MKAKLATIIAAAMPFAATSGPIQWNRCQPDLFAVKMAAEAADLEVERAKNAQRNLDDCRSIPLLRDGRSGCSLPATDYDIADKRAREALYELAMATRRLSINCSDK